MKRPLQIVIESGETTCASEPGRFCPWVRTTHFGQRFLCGLFDGKSLGENDNGWLRRLPECLAAEEARNDG